MDWIAIPVCVLAGAMIVWIQRCEAREQRNAADHIRALQTARTFTAAMADNCADVHSPPDDVGRRVQRVVATSCEQAVYPEKVTVDPQRLSPTDDLVFDLLRRGRDLGEQPKPLASQGNMIQSRTGMNL
jgi:hypothetical protein